MNRSTKLLVILSNLCAIWAIATLVSRGVPPILVPTATAFAVSCLAAALLGDTVTGIVLSLIYAVPAALFALYNNFVFSFYAIWLAALCGAMLPRAIGSKWAYPERFTSPLVLWALVLALSWPLVVLREVDFVPQLLIGMPGAKLSQSPGIVTVWIASVAAISMTGLLLLDWLFLVYPADQMRSFEARVIWPMFAGAACAAGIAVYQAAVDITFLNHTYFGSVGRAVGTMRDGNAFGASAALWVPVAAAMGVTSAVRPKTAALWGLCFAMMATGVWASGSRTALLASLIGVAVVIAHARRLFTRRQIGAGIVTAVVLFAAIGFVVPSTTWTRIKSIIPTFSSEAVHDTIYQLWSRDWYGTVAVKMIAEHPFVGVGVGGFNYQFSEVLYRINGTARPPDNAQNWYRQQLAEIGIVGSLGWISWMCLFGWLMARRSEPQERPVVGGAAMGAILGLSAASLLGMPTQDAAASITFVVMACWYLKLRSTAAVEVSMRSRPAKLEWAAILGLVGCFLGGTVYAARADLRPPLRALRVGSTYSYGFIADENDPAVRWTRGKAVDVFRAEKRWLKMSIGDVAPDAASKPVNVEVWMNRNLILRVDRRGNFPITRWIRMPPYRTLLMFEVHADRTWRPADFGGSADRDERGVAIREWSFSDDDPPKGSVTVESPPAPMFATPGTPH
jgi:hypothetical protein